MNRCIVCDYSDLVGILFFFLVGILFIHFLRPAFYTVLAFSMLDAEIQEIKYQVGKFFQIVQATVGKTGLKLNIQKMKIMANRWGNNGNSERLYFLGLQNHFRW